MVNIQNMCATEISFGIDAVNGDGCAFYGQTIMGGPKLALLFNISYTFSAGNDSVFS